MLTTMAAEEKLLQRGKWTYISALLLIAALNLGSHIIADSIVHRQSDTARIVNLSGRQRMLSQRIVKIALERALRRTPHGDPAAQRILRESVDRMTAVHNGLLHGSAELQLSAPPPSVAAIYTGPAWNLDGQVQRFLLHARRLADKPAARLALYDPDLLEIEEEARSPLLNALDAAVVACQEHSERAIESLRRLLAGLSIAMLLILLAEALFLFRPLFIRLTTQQQHLISIGRTDPLTGCFNRRAFEELAPAAIDRARRSNEPLAILTLDLDHFKSVNDTHGHGAGDLVLQAFTTTLNQHIRSSDLLCRIGGEEFALILPQAAHADLLAVADRFRAAVERTSVAVGSKQLRFTVSVGGATLHPSDATLRDFTHRADLALYEAKRLGRNRVHLAPTPQRCHPEQSGAHRAIQPKDPHLESTHPQTVSS